MVKFNIEKVSDRVTKIYGICTELMYLIEGDTRAALIDTGSGFGSLSKTVSSLTDKPLIVLLTHGHTDHAMGAGEFAEVYMNHEDDYIYAPHSDKAFRLEGVQMSDSFKQVTEQDYIPAAPVQSFQNLSGGDIFDLGGATIEVFSCAGHTKGSLVMLLKEERLLFLGDACNGNTFLFEDYSLPVWEYEANLRKLYAEIKGRYDQALAFHGNGILPSTIIEEVIEVCVDVQNQNTDDIPFTFRGNNGWIAKAVDHPRGLRQDGKTGNIVYNKSNI